MKHRTILRSIMAAVLGITCGAIYVFGWIALAVVIGVLVAIGIAAVLLLALGGDPDEYDECTRHSHPDQWGT